MRKPVAAVLLILALSAPLGAWSAEGHRLILGRAIALLPAPIRPVFEGQRAMLLERAVDPDLWRVAGFDEEAPRHFLDCDAYGAYPFAALPREYGAALEKYGHETLARNGLLPWHAAEMYGRLVRAFEQQKAGAGVGLSNALFLSAVLSHYVADAHQPLHAALNYDGQLTGQRGLHARFEDDLLSRNRAALVLRPGTPSAITDPRDAMFEALLASYQFVDPLLRADRAAAAGRTEYDDAYYDALFASTKPMLERRLSDAITMSAAMIAGAWERAGRPDLSALAARPVRKVGGK